MSEFEMLLAQASAEGSRGGGRKHATGNDKRLRKWLEIDHEYLS